MIFRSTSSRSRRRFPERRARFPPPRSLVRVRERHRWTRRASFRHHHRPRSRARSPDARARASAPTKDADVARDGDRWPKSRLFARPLGGSLTSADSPPLPDPCARACRRVASGRVLECGLVEMWRENGKTPTRARRRKSAARAVDGHARVLFAHTRDVEYFHAPARARARRGVVRRWAHTWACASLYMTIAYTRVYTSVYTRGVDAIVDGRRARARAKTSARARGGATTTATRSRATSAGRSFAGDRGRWTDADGARARARVICARSR